VRTLVLAPVELHDDAALAPQAVDRPGADGLVAPRQLDAAADELRAEAALETALHLAVPGRVLREGRTEVGAAGVAAAQDALDVGGAQVVLELGLRERSQ
jgi:hypothetical protein